MRSANAIDFWRGFALLNIFLSHMPGNAFERLSHRHYSLTDAEAFVFLAGWALRVSVGATKTSPRGTGRRRASQRISKLYKAQAFMVAAALLIVATAALLTGDPGIVARQGDAGLADRPFATLAGALLLTRHLRYFDILPLYIVLSCTLPFLLKLNARSPVLLLFASGTVWAVAVAFRMNLPNWPAPGSWFFDPFAWQFCFNLGYVLAGDDAPAPAMRAFASRLFWPALAIAGCGDLAVVLHIAPDCLTIDGGWSSILFSKTILGPARVLHFLAMLVVASGVYPLMERRFGTIVHLFSLLGRNSLQVFVAASLLSLVGRIVKDVYGRGLLLDFEVAAAGAIIMILVGWGTECLQKLRRKNSGERTYALAASGSRV